MRQSLKPVVHVWANECTAAFVALYIQRVYKALVALNEAIARVPEQMDVADRDETFLLSPPMTFVDQQLVDVIRQVLTCWGVKLLALRAPNLRISYIVSSGFTTEHPTL